VKILFVAYKFGTEKEIGEHLGTYHYFIETLRRMVALGHEVSVAAPWLSFRRRGSEDVDGVKVLRYYPPLFNRPKSLLVNWILRSWYIMATSRRILDLDRKQQWDAICVWQARETGFAVAKIASKLRAPFIFRQITAWQWHFERMKRDRKFQEKFAKAIYASAKQIIFVSRAAADAERALGLPEEKIRIMAVAIETDLFKPGNQSKNGNTILFVGRINFAEKGIGYLLDAMPEVLRRLPAAKLVIVGGGGESQRLLAQIKTLGIENSVRVVGEKPFNELPQYLNASDVMVVPSIWLEAFGQVTIIAMACGVPVVTSDIGGSVEINLDGQTGFVVPRADSHALAEAILKILRDPQLAKTLGQNARKRVEEHYSYEVLVNKFLKLIGELK